MLQDFPLEIDIEKMAATPRSYHMVRSTDESHLMTSQKASTSSGAAVPEAPVTPKHSSSPLQRFRSLLEDTSSNKADKRKSYCARALLVLFILTVSGLTIAL